jgi:hypothetical protein
LSSDTQHCCPEVFEILTATIIRVYATFKTITDGGPVAQYSNGDSHPFDRKIWSAIVSAGVHAEKFAQWQVEVEINSDYHGKYMSGLPINELGVNDMRKVMIDQRSFMKVIQEYILPQEL